MPSIRVLEKSVAELIAAGEVVERPASVVKELMENSIDAGATSITVEIRGGGVGYLRITDNGCGIAPEEMPLAFLRHATSKVHTERDLDAILTLGFRGEALASIAAVAKVEMRSRMKGAEGAVIFAEGGGIGLPEPAGCPEGTTIIVRDIFFNTPARMKFLRRDVSEGNAVGTAVEKAALSHPEISFRLIRDGQTRLSTSGSGELLPVIAAVYGREAAQGMLRVDYSYERRIHVQGYVSDPSAARPSRALQNFFINSRYVRVKACTAALEEAFKGRLMAGRFPAAALNLEIAPGEVDVNVHPAKTEVRFSDERPIFQAVYYAVKTALAAMPAPLEARPRPEINAITLDLADESPVQQELAPVIAAPAASAPVSVSEPKPAGEAGGFSRPVSLAAPGAGTKAPPVSDSPASPVSTRLFDEFRAALSDTMKAKRKLDLPLPEEDIKQEQKPAKPPASAPGMRLIGEAFGTYLLLEQGEDLVLVDKHAAHEGMLYRRVLEDAKRAHRQVLLSAMPLKMPMEEYSILLEHSALLEETGFLVEDFGMGSLIVREAPMALAGEDIEAMLGEMAAALQRHSGDITPSLLEELCHSIACKAALRAGDKNSRAELEALADMLAKHPEITNCPHGRPVSVRMPKGRLERMFGRLGA